MIIDITGTTLIPGNQGKDRPGNGMNPDIECCCDECDKMICCFATHLSVPCEKCTNLDCPRSGAVQKQFCTVNEAETTGLD